MVRRSVIAALWFFAAAWGWNLLSLATGLPTYLGILLGLVFAGVVLLGSDPGVGSVVRQRMARPAADRRQASAVSPDRLHA